MSVDPVMRTIVCRVPFMSLTMDALVTATGLTRPKLMLSVNRLVDMSLLRWARDDQGNMLIIPVSELARRFMGGWADYWCVGDDQCGVGR